MKLHKTRQRGVIAVNHTAVQIIIGQRRAIKRRQMRRADQMHQPVAGRAARDIGPDDQPRQV